jgi:hypothetical protein
MAKGFDCSIRLDAEKIRLMKELHPEIRFVCRYVGDQSNPKNMTREEFDLIMDLTNWNVVGIFETNPTYDRYFTHERGIADGRVAAAGAKSAGYYEGAIYCTVDYDAPLYELDKIYEYVMGFSSGLLMQDCMHQIGVYGSDYVCGSLHQRLVNIKTWRSMSTGWLKWGREEHYNLIQSPGGVTPFEYDLDESDGNAGGCRRTHC